ncbi:MAG: catechol 2,3-dioxygenase-like lactoylglutathione lyase family enzyme [Candidatus Poriferisodalaceae bacterium]|jgi:catechol 2,3-dioxygenase-like lactoylglutathione lyase family enzyme
MTMNVTKAGFDLGLVTNNGDAMLEFYRDVLGLRFEATLTMEKAGIAAMHRVWANDSLLKIVVPVTAPKAAPEPGGISTATGFRYFTFTIDNLDDVLAAVEAAGLPVIWPRREIRPGVNVGMVEDPDGNWVEFVEVS